MVHGEKSLEKATSCELRAASKNLEAQGLAHMFATVQECDATEASSMHCSRAHKNFMHYLPFYNTLKFFQANFPGLAIRLLLLYLHNMFEWWRLLFCQLRIKQHL